MSKFTVGVLLTPCASSRSPREHLQSRLEDLDARGAEKLHPGLKCKSLIGSLVHPLQGDINRLTSILGF
jgi:hypothetical protein